VLTAGIRKRAKRKWQPKCLWLVEIEDSGKPVGTIYCRSLGLAYSMARSIVQEENVVASLRTNSRIF
jgi:hypothetical protein